MRARKRRPGSGAAAPDDAIFMALADPTRRSILQHLNGGPKPVGIIAGHLPVSRPAVSQHLKILREAGLVADTADGARRVYSIDPKGLAPLRAWLDQFWGEALTAFAEEVGRSAHGKKDKT